MVFSCSRIQNSTLHKSLTGHAAVALRWGLPVGGGVAGFWISVGGRISALIGCPVMATAPSDPARFSISLAWFSCFHVCETFLPIESFGGYLLVIRDMYLEGSGGS